MLSPLRLLAQRGVASRAVLARTAVRSLAPATSTTSVRCFSAEAPKPSAFDVVVQLTFVDPNGARRQVPGYVGKSSLPQLYGEA